MVGVVIVTYNSLAVIGRCLDACMQVNDATVVVIDNASVDNTVGEVRKRQAVLLIANSTNRGFAAAVNQGFESLQTETVLVLNPDTILKGGVRELELAVTSKAGLRPRRECL